LLDHVPLHPDGDLYAIIRDGVPDRPMPPFGDVLEEDEIWHLVNYLRAMTR
jgi:mono/diheme cytochrome c family protein